LNFNQKYECRALVLLAVVFYRNDNFKIKLAYSYTNFRRGFKTGPSDSRLLPEVEVDDESGNFFDSGILRQAFFSDEKKMLNLMHILVI